jgi:ketosteroid isomerase-like protein
MRILIIAALSCVALPCLAEEIPEALRKSVASGNQDWVDGLKAHDAARVAVAYEENATNCAAGHDCVQGRAAFVKQLAERIAKMGVVTDAWVRSARTVLDGDLAYEWGRAGFRHDGKEFAGRYVTVWRKQADGTWKIFHNAGLPG